MFSFSIKKLNSLRLVKTFAGKYSQCEHKIGAKPIQTNSWRQSKEHIQNAYQFVSSAVVSLVSRPQHNSEGMEMSYFLHLEEATLVLLTPNAWLL